jgi:hypothetical protein
MNHFQSPMDNGEKKVQITFDHPWTTQIISICPWTMEIMSGHPWMMEINSSALEVRQWFMGLSHFKGIRIWLDKKEIERG